jgi:hypothetical protein
MPLIGRLRVAALGLALVGAIGSLGLMFYVGRRQQSLVLMVMFTVWVVSPFVGAVVAARVSSTWSPSTRATLYVAMMIVALGSLGIYAILAFGPPVAKAAAPFLIVPAASWLLMTIAVAIAAAASGRQRDRHRP